MASMERDTHVSTTAISLDEINSGGMPPGVDRRAFMMRSAAVGAAAVIAGCKAPESQQAPASAAAPAAPPATPAGHLSPDLEVVKKAKGPVMTTIDEFYKVGPGPSSSHTIGPMRITYALDDQ
jgi:L-serine dehydratase